MTEADKIIKLEYRHLLNANITQGCAALLLLADRELITQGSVIRQCSELKGFVKAGYYMDYLTTGENREILSTIDMAYEEGIELSEAQIRPKTQGGKG